MSLSCSCGEWEGEGWFYYPPDDFIHLETKRRKRCCSCNALIDIGAYCASFERRRAPESDVECRIYGEDGEIEIATWYMCEKCAEQYFNLEDLGYCINLGDDMFELLKEYQEIKKADAEERVKEKLFSQLKEGDRVRYIGKRGFLNFDPADPEMIFIGKDEGTTYDFLVEYKGLRMSVRKWEFEPISQSDEVLKDILNDKKGAWSKLSKT